MSDPQYSSFKIVIIFNNTSAEIKTKSADVLLKIITILKELRIAQLCSKNEWTLFFCRKLKALLRKNVLNDITAATFLVSLSPLPAVKKDTKKRFSRDVIMDIRTYYIVMSLYLMSSIQRTTFLTKLTVQMVNPEAGEHLERKSANQLRPHYKKATRYIPYKSCTTHVTQKDRAFL